MCTDVVGKRAELQSDDLVVRHIAQRIAECLVALSLVDAYFMPVKNSIQYRTQHAVCLQSVGCDVSGNGPRSKLTIALAQACDMLLPDTRVAAYLR